MLGAGGGGGGEEGGLKNVSKAVMSPSPILYNVFDVVLCRSASTLPN